MRECRRQRRSSSPSADDVVQPLARSDRGHAVGCIPYELARVLRSRREPRGRPGRTKDMRRGRILTISLAAALVLGACSGGSDREQPLVRASASTAASEAPGPSGRDRSSLSGRIAFDNHEDVWTINADGTDLTRLTHSPAFEFDPSWSPDGTQIAYRSDRGTSPRSGS
jgi:WD40-like Beta Propeller Repeat